MAGQISELVLDRFLVSENDFDDLDAIVRRHCQTIKYYVYRGSILGGYDTEDLNVLLKERNGPDAKIESASVQATGLNGLKFDIDFDENIGITGECEDRASLVLLATEARGLIKDRMRAGTTQRQNILYAVVFGALVIAYLLFQQYQTATANSFNAAQAVRSNQAYAGLLRQEKADTRATQSMLNQARTALSKHDINAEIGVLVQQQIEQLSQQVDAEKEPTYAPRNPPSWTNSFWLAAAVACGAAGTAYGIVGFVFLPGGGSIFLIGDEKRRQEKLRQLRANIKWGVIAALVIGILASVIASRLV